MLQHGYTSKTPQDEYKNPPYSYDVSETKAEGWLSQTRKTRRNYSEKRGCHNWPSLNFFQSLHPCIFMDREKYSSGIHYGNKGTEL